VKRGLAILQGEGGCTERGVKGSRGYATLGLWDPKFYAVPKHTAVLSHGYACIRKNAPAGGSESAQQLHRLRLRLRPSLWCPFLSPMRPRASYLVPPRFPPAPPSPRPSPGPTRGSPRRGCAAAAVWPHIVAQWEAGSSQPAGEGDGKSCRMSTLQYSLKVYAFVCAGGGAGDAQTIGWGVGGSVPPCSVCPQNASVYWVHRAPYSAAATADYADRGPDSLLPLHSRLRPQPGGCGRRPHDLVGKQNRVR